MPQLLTWNKCRSSSPLQKYEKTKKSNLTSGKKATLAAVVHTTKTRGKQKKIWRFIIHQFHYSGHSLNIHMQHPQHLHTIFSKRKSMSEKLARLHLNPIIDNFTHSSGQRQNLRSKSVCRYFKLQVTITSLLLELHHQI